MIYVTIRNYCRFWDNNKTYSRSKPIILTVHQWLRIFFLLPFQDITFSSSESKAKNRTMKFAMHDIFAPSPAILTFCFPTSPSCIYKIDKISIHFIDTIYKINQCKHIYPFSGGGETALWKSCCPVKGCVKVLLFKHCKTWTNYLQLDNCKRVLNPNIKVYFWDWCKTT